MPYLQDLNTLEFSIWHILYAIDQAMPRINLAALVQYIVMEWDWLAAEYLPLILLLSGGRHGKNGAFIE